PLEIPTPTLPSTHAAPPPSSPTCYRPFEFRQNNPVRDFPSAQTPNPAPGRQKKFPTHSLRLFAVWYLWPTESDPTSNAAFRYAHQIPAQFPAPYRLASCPRSTNPQSPRHPQLPEPTSLDSPRSTPSASPRFDSNPPCPA